jgi:hypothetical protein
MTSVPWSMADADADADALAAGWSGASAGLPTNAR